MTTLDDALARVSVSRLRELTQMLVATASPTGEEGDLATQIAHVLDTAGMRGRTRWLDANAANAWGVLGSTDRGPSLLLYSPIDTLTAGNPALGLPWASQQPRPDMEPEPRQEHGWLVGLGAQNPKGHAACVLMAAEALAAGADLPGRVVAGFGCLGMPMNRRAPHLLDGHGSRVRGADRRRVPGCGGDRQVRLGGVVERGRSGSGSPCGCRGTTPTSAAAISSPTATPSPTPPT